MDIENAHQLLIQVTQAEQSLPLDVSLNCRALRLCLAAVRGDREELQRLALQAPEERQSSWHAARHWNALASGFLEAGQLPEAHAYCLKAARIYRALEIVPKLIGDLRIAAQISLLRGDFRAAREYLEEALLLGEPTSYDTFLMHHKRCQTWIYDRDANGRAWMEAGLAAWRNRLLAHPAKHVGFMHLLGPLERIARETDQHDRFVRLLEENRARLREAGYDTSAVWYLRETRTLRPLPADGGEEWEWHPGDGGSRSPRQDGMTLVALPLRGVKQMNMPRLLRKVRGDFALQVRLDSAAEVDASMRQCRREAATGRISATSVGGGGLLVQHGQQDVLRIFAHLREPGEVVCAIRQDNWELTLGRGLLPDGPVYLRLERKGKTIRGYAGSGGDTWYCCGETEWMEWEEVEIGLFAECLVELYPIVCRAETRFGDLRLHAGGALVRPGASRIESIYPPPERHPYPDFPEMVAEGKRMRRLFAAIRQAAQDDTPALIAGDTGTGKELVARALHRLGPRSRGPLVTVNCAAIPAELLERELFGHVRGAYTGAYENHGGLFESAHQGILFLDEIGEASPALQAALLRVVEEKAVRRVGDPRLRQVDVRIIAATNRDLEGEVEQRRFRQDLYFRLTWRRIVLPPLRQRREEIPHLAYRALELWSQRRDIALPHFSESAMEALQGCAWPGNVRELFQVVEQAASRAEDGLIALHHLPSASRTAPTSAETEDEKARVQTALDEARGNRSEAARQLGVSRRTLYRRLEKLGLM